MQALALSGGLRLAPVRPMLSGMYKTECPNCGETVPGENHGTVHYFCPRDGEFRVSGSAEAKWAAADRQERQRVLTMARANGKPPVVLAEYFERV